MALDSSVLGERLAAARGRGGLTRQDMAREAGMDRSMIAKIETGVRRVTALELVRLAKVLGERVEWFLQEPTPSIVSHRNVADPGEPSPGIDVAVERFARATEFVSSNDRRLRELLRGLPSIGQSLDAGLAEEISGEARDFLGLAEGEPVLDLGSRLAELGLLTWVVDLGPDSADAGSVLLVDGALAVVNGNLRTGRRRLALAHEFVHVLVQGDYTIDWRVASTAVSREAAIDRIARALLLPKNALEQLWVDWGGGRDGTRRDAVVRLASHFRVDSSTLSRRLLELGLIDADQADFVRRVKTTRPDIVEYNLVVADELPSNFLPNEYANAVLRLFRGEIVGEHRSLDLLLDCWSIEDLPQLPPRESSEIWQVAG